MPNFCNPNVTHKNEKPSMASRELRQLERDAGRPPLTENIQSCLFAFFGHLSCFFGSVLSNTLRLVKKPILHLPLLPQTIQSLDSFAQQCVLFLISTNVYPQSELKSQKQYISHIVNCIFYMQKIYYQIKQNTRQKMQYLICFIYTTKEILIINR